MDTQKSKTIIAVVAIVVAGIVVVLVSYLYLNRPISQQGTPAPTSLSTFDNHVPTESKTAVVNGPVLSMGINSTTKAVVSASCELPAGQTCQLWAEKLSGGFDLVMSQTVARPETEKGAAKRVLTWDLSGKRLRESYGALQARSFDASGKPLGQSTLSHLPE